MDVAAFTQRLTNGLELMGERIPGIMADPRAYPRETMIVALIAAVGLIVTVLTAVWLQGWAADRATRTRLKLRRRRGTLVMRWLAAAAVAASLMALASIAPVSPFAGPACGSCHAVARSVTAWQSDSHRDVGCYACHARGGVLGAMEATARGVGSLIGSSRRTPANDGSCLDCHENVRTGVLESRGMRVRHEDIIGAGMSCLICHDRTGHSAETTPAAATRGEISITRPMMSRCLRCHDGEAAPAGCSTCHVGRLPSDTSAESTPRGDTPAPLTCEGCHRASVQKGCVDCHGLELPHPPEFRGQHAGASARDTALCTKCHELASSDLVCACHSDVNEHGTYSRWFPIHSVAAATNGPGGCRCHSAQFCMFCHEAYPFR